MQPERLAMSDYNDPNLYLCPHCGQVIAIGNDELAGDEEVVPQRMNHASPGAPTIPIEADSSDQLCDPGGGGVGHNRAGPATIGAHRHAQGIPRHHPDGVVRDPRQPDLAQWAHQASGPARTIAPTG
jgi:hypothetical protein